MKVLFLSLLLMSLWSDCKASGIEGSASCPEKKQRVLVSTDIGGTDPDDNQSMAHLLMYTDCFDLEGLVSSPSYGNGSKEEILRMIDIYEKDLPKLSKNINGLMSPEELRSITKQGRKGAAPYCGYSIPTEGSECNAGFYDAYMKGAGNLGADYVSYYKGLPKMGDTPGIALCHER